MTRVYLFLGGGVFFLVLNRYRNVVIIITHLEEELSMVKNRAPIREMD